LKSNNDRIRTPAYTRAAYRDGGTDREMSVGDVLRSARKALIVRQIVFFFLIIAVLVAVISVFAFGLMDDLIESLSDRLIG